MEVLQQPYMDLKAVDVKAGQMPNWSRGSGQLVSYVGSTFRKIWRDETKYSARVRLMQHEQYLDFECSKHVFALFFAFEVA